MTKQDIYKTACSNCSCKCWIKALLVEPLLSETMDLYFERKRTGKTFQCYMRWKWKACMIFSKALEYIDKNKQLFPKYI